MQRMAEKIWHIRVNRRAEGPYAVEELKANPSVTPDTLAWREGFAEWKAIRFIPELMWALFGLEAESEEGDEKRAALLSAQENELVLEMKQDPRFILLLLLLALLLTSLMIYLWYEGP